MLSALVRYSSRSGVRSLFECYSLMVLSFRNTHKEINSTDTKRANIWVFAPTLEGRAWNLLSTSGRWFRINVHNVHHYAWWQSSRILSGCLLWTQRPISTPHPTPKNLCCLVLWGKVEGVHLGISLASRVSLIFLFSDTDRRPACPQLHHPTPQSGFWTCWDVWQADVYLCRERENGDRIMTSSCAWPPDVKSRRLPNRINLWAPKSQTAWEICNRISRRHYWSLKAACFYLWGTWQVGFRLHMGKEFKSNLFQCGCSNQNETLSTRCGCFLCRSPAWVV